MERKVAIVIVNWNGRDDTITALNSLKQLDTRGKELSVIVVDNGSTNDSVSAISKAHPLVKLIQTGQNLGFTGGNNVGIREALEENAVFIWLLNNDTIIDRNALTILEAFKDPRVGVVGSKIYFAPGHEYHKDRYAKKEQGKVIWYAGGIVDWANMYASHRGVDEVDRKQYDKIEETTFITGCSMMVRREVFDKIGLLDDAYYLYFEDLDFCLRALKAGYKLVYYPKSVIWHVNAGSSGGAGNPLHDYYLTRNRLRIGVRYAPMRTKFALIREAIGFVLSGPSVKRAAVLDALLGKFGKQYEPRKF